MARKRRRPPPPLSSHDRSTIRSLVQSDVVTTFAGLQRFLNESHWVGKSNRYSRDTVKKIRSEIKAGPIRSPRQLSQYIAASSLLHCADGWSYFGKAISSLIRGDPHRSRHLAYYAELRAALSLLAGEGMGIFQHQHFAINGPNSVVKLNTGKGTHEVVWNCLEFWGQQKRSGDLFTKIIKPYGRSLDDWLMPLGGGKVVSPQAQRWFRQWGMDLRTFADDRNARNVSSYRPDGIPDAWRLNASATLEFIREVWTAFEPAPNSTFNGIDRHILRIALETVFKGQTNLSPADDPPKFKVWVARMLEYQGLSLEIAKEWLQFLTRQSSSEDASIFSLSGKPPDQQEHGHLGIISRAALLLRVATGAISELVQEAGISAGAIEFWWQGMGHGRGLWDGERDDAPLIDLWADIESLLGDIEAFQ